jgi:hypothetical protein
MSGALSWEEYNARTAAGEIFEKPPLVMPPGFRANGELIDYDGPLRMPVTLMSASEALQRISHIAVEHPDLTIGLCLIHEVEDEWDDDGTRGGRDEHPGS